MGRIIGTIVTSADRCAKRDTCEHSNAPGSLKPDEEEQQGEMVGPKASETTQHVGANGSSRSKLVHVSVGDDKAAQNEKNRRTAQIPRNGWV
jgi:hypothetical protein